MMPIIGDVVRGKDINRTGESQQYIWQACVSCGKKRWVRLIRTRTTNEPMSKQCFSCGIKHRIFSEKGRLALSEKAKKEYRPIGANHPLWKGGRFKDKQGYVHIWLAPDDFFYSMTDSLGYVREHRLVMATHLGRCLQRWEKVHHKDGVKDNNEYGNLKLTTLGSHLIEHSKGYRDGYQQGLLDGREKQIQELKQEIKLVQFQNKQLMKQLSDYCKQPVKGD